MPGEGRFGLAPILAALRERVEKTSIRTVAREVGMSPSGLHIVLGGSRPRPATRRKLVEWHLRVREKRSEVPADDVDAAVAVLERYLRADGRLTVRQRRVRELAERLFGDPDTNR